MANDERLYYWIFFTILLFSVICLTVCIAFLSKRNLNKAIKNLKKISHENNGELKIGGSFFDNSLTFAYRNRDVSIKFSEGLKRKYHTEILTNIEISNSSGKNYKKTIKGLRCLEPAIIYSEINSFCNREK